MRILKAVALLLVIVGAVNWLLVGIAQFDLVAAITGDTFGETNALSSVVYILVGLSGVALAADAGSVGDQRLRGRHRLTTRLDAQSQQRGRRPTGRAASLHVRGWGRFYETCSAIPLTASASAARIVPSAWCPREA